jgi:hypothetical protein
MKGIAKHSMEYVDAFGLKRWVGLELEFDQSQTHPLNALANVEKLVQHAIPKHNNQILGDYSHPLPEVQVNSKDRESGITIEDILSCNDIPTIDSYRLLIRDQPLLQQAYNKRREEIKQAEISDIMRRKNELTQKQ